MHDVGTLLSNINGNIRCALAIFHKVEGTATANWSETGVKRPMLRKRITNWVICNIHAGGIDYIMDALKIIRVQGYDKKWAIAGDFNQEPSTVKKLIIEGEFVIAPNTPTRKASGRILDYAVSNRDGSATVGPDYDGSDHLSVDVHLNESL